jgi:2-methylisocitrate lyase-like PEP mutase family enzyme
MRSIFPERPSPIPASDVRTSALTTATEVAQTLAHITDRVRLPVIVDGDTGFGNALNVQRTVRDFERAGAAMIQLEDQGFPKRCGHLDGKTVVTTGEMCGKLRAALDARHGAQTLIMARTDALASEGLEAALERAERYLECGVDALFIEALRSPEQMRVACERFASRIPPVGEHGGRRQDAGAWRAGTRAHWGFASSSSRGERPGPWRIRSRATTRR